MWLSSGNLPANAGSTGDTGSIPGQEDPLEGEMVTHSSMFAGLISQREEGYSPWVHRELDTTELD